MLELGGNIYFTAKLGATDGHSFQHLAAVMTGSTQQDYAAMMLEGGRSVEGNRRSRARSSPRSSRRSQGERQGRRQDCRQDQGEAGPQDEIEIQAEIEISSQTEVDIVAKIVAGVGSSHVPAIGAAIDNKQTEEPYWKRVFSGFEKSQEWMAESSSPTSPSWSTTTTRRRSRSRSDPDLRARLRGGIPAGRRGLGPAPGAGGARAIPSSPRTSRSR